MNKLNFWEHTVFRTGYKGDPEVVATYVSETSAKAVQDDLASGYSHLRDYLERFFRCSADKYAADHPLRAEALLGAMSASLDCSLRSGFWLPVEPAPTKPLPALPLALEKPIKSEGGVSLWILGSITINPDSL